MLPGDAVLGDALPRRIVVPLDGSQLAERAIPTATYVAARFGARVETVTVVSGRSADGAPPDAEVVLRGEPVEALCRHVADGPPALLCLSSHGYGGVRRLVVGSVAEGLLRDGPAPVLVHGPAVEPGVGPGIATIIVGLARSPHLDHLVELLCVWAPHLATGVELVHVRRPVAAELYAGRVTGRAPADRPELETIRDRLTARDVEVRLHPMLGPDPVQGLLALAERAPRPGWLAVDSHHAGESKGHDVAVRLIRRSPWPVLASTGLRSGPRGPS